MYRFNLTLTKLMIIFSMTAGAAAFACPKTGRDWQEQREKWIQNLERNDGPEFVEATHTAIKQCREEAALHPDRFTETALACTNDFYYFLDFLTRKAQGLAGPFAPEYRNQTDVKEATKVPEELLKPEFLSVLQKANFEDPSSIETVENLVEEINKISRKRFTVTVVPNFGRQSSMDKTGKHRIAFLVTYSGKKLVQFIQATLRDKANPTVSPKQLSIIAVQDGKSYFNDYLREGFKLIERKGDASKHKAEFMAQESCMLCHTSGPTPFKPLDDHTPHDPEIRPFLEKKRYVKAMEAFNNVVRKSFTRKSPHLNDGLEDLPLIGSRNSVISMTEENLLACSGFNPARMNETKKKFVLNMRCAKCHNGKKEQILGSSGENTFLQYRRDMPPGWINLPELNDPRKAKDQLDLKAWQNRYHRALQRCVVAANLKELRSVWTHNKCTTPDEQ